MMKTGQRMIFAALLFAISAYGPVANAASAQQTFASPEEAVGALVAAVKQDDVKTMRSVLGNAGGTLASGDRVADRAETANFVKQFDTKHAIDREGDTARLTIGPEAFPFAFPIVKTGERWHFDTRAGIDEISARRIGQNEIHAINVLQAIVDAEREYALEDRDGDGVLAYARRFASTPGKRDGLYWRTKAGEPASPLGELVARASAEGYKGGKAGPTPFHGYYYRFLKDQAASTDAPAFDYVVRGRAIGGFAVVAYPSKYGNSGIMTFIVNQDGKVYQTDLGRETQAKASAMQRFDPAKGWSPVTVQ